MSLVGRNIRAILHQLGDAFELFAEQKIYLVSQAANDLNFTFVVDENQGDRLVEQLHELLIRPVPGDRVLGPTWEQLFAKPAAGPRRATPWWQRKRAQLLRRSATGDAAYVYDVRIGGCRGAHAAQPQVREPRALRDEGQPASADAARAACRRPRLRMRLARRSATACSRCCRTSSASAFVTRPNFAPRDEYRVGLRAGRARHGRQRYVLEAWPEVFRGRGVFVRVDTGTGRGHHHHVRTAGTHSKFGVPLAELGDLAQARRRRRRADRRTACSQRQRRLRHLELGADRGAARAALGEQFPDVRVIDVGGGFAVPERADQPGVDLARLDAALAAVQRRTSCTSSSGSSPAAICVAAAGVLLARVTQLKSKGGVRYVGVAHRHELTASGPRSMARITRS